MNNIYKNKQINITENKQCVISNYTKKITISHSSPITIYEYTKKIIVPNSVNYLNIDLKYTQMMIVPQCVKNHTLQFAKKIFMYNSKIISHEHHNIFQKEYNIHYEHLNKSVKNLLNIIFVHTLRKNKLRNLFHVNNTTNICNESLYDDRDKINKKLLNFTYLMRFTQNINIEFIDCCDFGNSPIYCVCYFEIKKYLKKIHYLKTIVCRSINNCLKITIRYYRRGILSWRKSHDDCIIVDEIK